MRSWTAAVAVAYAACWWGPPTTPHAPPPVAPAWTVATPVAARLEAVWGASASDVFAVGERGTIVRSRDRGATWQPLASRTDFALHAIAGTGSDDIYVVGDRDHNGPGGEAVLLHSADDGATWQARAVPHLVLALAVVATGPGHALAFGQLDDKSTMSREPRALVDQPSACIGCSGGAFVATADAGASWTVRGQSVQMEWVSAAWRRGPTVWVAGYANASVAAASDLMASQDGGQRYAAEPAGRLADPGLIADTPHGLWGSSVDDVYAVGPRGLVMHRDGDRWSVLHIGAADLLAVWGSDARDVWIAGAAGTLLHVHDGRNFEHLPAQTRADLRGVWGASANDVYVVGDHGTIAHWQ
nr:hypothetical protein [Kofleriaceae bacterium]